MLGTIDYTAPEQIRGEAIEWHMKHIVRKLRIDESLATNKRVLAVLAFLRAASARA